ncbi:hypothetical protein I312_103571 [Cryptococcus bacillisporus CA1280]|uniref:uncharacterized protein n=1 Tax=Cryptococcus bacillisporus CA1280 TaxID=1296109 RepID=UPI0033663FCB
MGPVDYDLKLYSLYQQRPRPTTVDGIKPLVVWKWGFNRRGYRGRNYEVDKRDWENGKRAVIRKYVPIVTKYKGLQKIFMK